MKKFLLISLLLVFAAGLGFSFDFGLLTEQKVEAEKDLLTYSPSLTPWFSWNGGRGVSVYLSGLLGFNYYKYGGDESDNSGWEKPALRPELSRFALGYRPSGNLFIEAGRIGYGDTLGFAAAGLFDGVRVEADLAGGSLSAGLFYTGFLYKETAKILMTEGDAQNYAKPWDWDSFGDYFASRRALASLRWDMPLGEENALSAEVLAQFDLNGNDEALHSQYGEVQAIFYPLSTMSVSAGALFQAMESSDSGFSSAFGILARFRTDIPGPLNDWLNITGKFTSGSWNDSIGAFTPLSSVTQGDVFKGTLSGLALVSADYNVRIINSLLVSGALRYFILTWDDPAAEGKLAGGEVWASVGWQPLDDIRLNLGGGAFFPGLGNAKLYEDKAQWKLSAGLTVSF